jgi:hypothetical protein
VSSVNGAKGVGRKQHNVGLVVGLDSWRVREGGERWFGKSFEMKWGQRVHPRGVSVM